MFSQGATFVRMVIPYDLLFASVKCFNILAAEASIFRIGSAKVLEATNEAEVA